MSHLSRLLISFCYLIWFAYSAERKTTILRFDNAGFEVVEALGGERQLFDEIADSIAYASRLRNNMPAHYEHIEAGAGGLVVKICFDDDKCWADKMFTGFKNIQNAYYGNAVTDIIRQYCPNIPVPTTRAQFKNRVHHEVTDWMEGTTLFDMVFESENSSYYSGGSKFRIPPKVTSSLAEFVYNVTTCPIPRDQCKVPCQWQTESI
jgi:hypothetical protein